MAQRQFRSDDTSRWREGFGKGSAGDFVVSSNITAGGGNLGVHYGTITGTSGATTATVPSGFSWLNKPCLIHQSQKTGAGNWELNVQIGISGTTATFKYPLQNNYTSGAQIVTINDYKNLTVNAGVTVGATAWNGSTGGIIPLIAKDTITINGTLSLIGANGVTGTGAGVGRGYQGGVGVDGQAYSGEGTTGGSVAQTTARGNGGGGGLKSGSKDGATGGGGGNGTAGAIGAKGGSSTAGAGGAVAGTANLTTMVFGGGGGGGSRSAGTNEFGSGAAGGGIALIIASNIIISGKIVLTGGSTSGAYWPGGAGAGGSCLIKAKTATLGITKITATGGTSTALGSYKGGNGGVGRIHLDYSKSYSGSTSPTLDVRQDSTIKARAGGANYYQYFL